MLYSPPDPNPGLWDTWIFPAEDTFHLFFLQRIKSQITMIVHLCLGRRDRGWLS